MWSFDRRAGVTLALMALASLAATARADARGEDSHEHRPSEGERPGARHEPMARPSHRTYSLHGQSAHTAAARESYAHEHPAAAHYAPMAAPGLRERVVTDGTTRAAPAGAWQAHALAAGPVRVVRYGNGNGTVERTIRPGLVSRTFVSSGHVVYARVYQTHVWHQFGRAFSYETFVPAVRYPAVYYSWALAPWPRPVAYSWGWQAQPWYPTYGFLFTPYPVYASPDLWMTDYIIARSMQTAYQVQTPALPAQQLPAAGIPAPPAPESSAAEFAPHSSDGVQPPQPSTAPPAPPSGDIPSAPPPSTPPAITPQVKAQLNNQIKVQLQEQQSAAAIPATLSTQSAPAQSAPAALRPNHVFFEVVQPLDVPSGAAKGYCALSANDYIKRTGGMSQDDWKIPVVVELSGPADCPQGLHTRIGLNDLNAMENEQEARVMEAMQAASKSMGPNGPPEGPGAHPTLIVDGSTAPDPMALNAIRQAQ